MKKYILIHCIFLGCLFFYPISLEMGWIKLNPNNSLILPFILCLLLDSVFCLFYILKYKELKQGLLSVPILIVGLLVWGQSEQFFSQRALDRRFAQNLELCSEQNPQYCLAAYHDFYPSISEELDFQSQQEKKIILFYELLREKNISHEDYVIIMSAKISLDELSKIYLIPGLNSNRLLLLKLVFASRCKNRAKDLIFKDLNKYWKVTVDDICD